MFLNRLWADWQKYLHFYLTGSVMVTIEIQWYSAETHCEQGPGNNWFGVPNRQKILCYQKSRKAQAFLT